MDRNSSGRKIREDEMMNENKKNKDENIIHLPIKLTITFK